MNPAIQNREIIVAEVVNKDVPNGQEFNYNTHLTEVESARRKEKIKERVYNIFQALSAICSAPSVAIAGV